MATSRPNPPEDLFEALRYMLVRQQRCIALGFPNEAYSSKVAALKRCITSYPLQNPREQWDTVDEALGYCKARTCELCCLQVDPPIHHKCEDCGTVWCCERHLVLDGVEHFKCCAVSKHLRSVDTVTIWEKSQPRENPEEAMVRISATAATSSRSEKAREVLGELRQWVNVESHATDGYFTMEKNHSTAVALEHAEVLKDLVDGMHLARCELEEVANDISIFSVGEFKDRGLDIIGSASPSVRKKGQSTPLAGAGHMMIKLVKLVNGLRSMVKERDARCQLSVQDLQMQQSRALDARIHFHNRISALEEELNMHVGKYKEQADWALQQRSEAQAETALLREQLASATKLLQNANGKILVLERENRNYEKRIKEHDREMDALRSAHEAEIYRIRAEYENRIAELEKALRETKANGKAKKPFKPFIPKPPPERVAMLRVGPSDAMVSGILPPAPPSPSDNLPTNDDDAYRDSRPQSRVSVYSTERTDMSYVEPVSGAREALVTLLNAETRSRKTLANINWALLLKRSRLLLLRETVIEENRPELLTRIDDMFMRIVETWRLRVSLIRASRLENVNRAILSLSTLAQDPLSTAFAELSSKDRLLPITLLVGDEYEQQPPGLTQSAIHRIDAVLPWFPDNLSQLPRDEQRKMLMELVAYAVSIPLPEAPTGPVQHIYSMELPADAEHSARQPKRPPSAPTLRTKESGSMPLVDEVPQPTPAPVPPKVNIPPLRVSAPYNPFDTSRIAQPARALPAHVAAILDDMARTLFIGNSNAVLTPRNPFMRTRAFPPGTVRRQPPRSRSISPPRVQYIQQSRPMSARSVTVAPFSERSSLPVDAESVESSPSHSEESSLSPRAPEVPTVQPTARHQTVLDMLRAVKTGQTVAMTPPPSTAPNWVSTSAPGSPVQGAAGGYEPVQPWRPAILAQPEPLRPSQLSQKSLFGNQSSPTRNQSPMIHELLERFAPVTAVTVVRKSALGIAEPDSQLQNPSSTNVVPVPSPASPRVPIPMPHIRLDLGLPSSAVQIRRPMSARAPSGRRSHRSAQGRSADAMFDVGVSEKSLR